MRIPDPKANTTTEAYLAYKAGYLEESELKPSLYEPYLHFDAWLAYWAGLVPTYPVKNVGKNLFNGVGWRGVKTNMGYPSPSNDGGTIVDAGSNNLKFNSQTTYSGVESGFIPVSEGQNFVLHLSIIKTCDRLFITQYDGYKKRVSELRTITNITDSTTFTTTKSGYITVAFASTVIGNSYEFEDIQLELGSSASSYEPYTSEPEMLTDEEALVAYLSGVTDTYPEEIKDPYDVRIVGYLKHLASIRWPEPDYPVNNEEFYLSTMEPTHTSNLEPSTDIELDTAEGKIINVEAYGDTYQQTYSGANLFNFRDTNGVGEGTTVSEDGFISQSKDNSSGTSSAFNNYFTHNLALDTSTTYTIVIEVQAVSGSGSLVPVGNHSTAQSTIQLEYLFSDLHAGDIIVGQFKTKSSFSGDNGLRGYTKYEAGESGSITYRISVLADTSVTPETFVYQPYTGGIPAPNPDYPQEVQTVTGEQTVTVTGKNLFDKVAEVATSPNYSLNSDGTITTDASNAQTGRRYMTLTMGPGTYTLSFRPYFSGVENPTIRFTIRNMDTSTDYIVKNINSPENGSLQVNSFTVENTTSVGFCIIPQARLEDGQTFYFDDTQLEEGSTATAYEPYQAQSYPISLGSTELCKIGDYQDYIYKSDDDWYVHKECGKVVFDGTEAWSGGASTGSPTYLYAYTSSLDALSLYSGKQAFCSHFTISENVLGTGTVVTSPCMSVVAPSAVTYAHIRLMIPLTYATTANEFKTWLGSNNITLYYVLTTPTDTKITDATLIGQLNALAGADTYNEKTFIGVTATDPNLPVLLKVEAYKYQFAILV